MTDPRPVPRSPAPPRRRSARLVRALAMTLGLLLGLLVLALIAGVTWQAVSERQDRATSAPPGELVDVGGYRLHLDVREPADDGGSPVTVVLDAASLSTAAQWGWVQHHLADEVRVVAYDRPGQGWSDAPPRPLDALGLSDDLQEALTAVGVDGPLVLAGHSMGSLTARAYLHQHPERVVGMVLIDPRFLSVQPIYPDENVDPRDDVFLALAPHLARAGVMRAMDPLGEQVDQLPQAEAQQGRLLLATTQQWDGALEDVLVGESAANLLAEHEPALRDLPLIVLTAPEPDPNAFPTPLRQRFTDQQALLAARSERAQLRDVPGADHYTIVTDPDHARVVADAILELTSVPNP